MLFNSQPFILGFLPLAVGCFFLAGRLGGPRVALGVLVAASLFFYAWWNPPFVLLPTASIVGNYLVGQHIFRLAGHGHRSAARRWLIGGIAGNLATLAWFKYADFAAESAARAFGLSPPTLHVFLPLAISFFTFQQIMFLVDGYRRDRPETGLLSYAAFVAFFPHLIAGPIVRPREILPQLTGRTIAVPRVDHFATGLTIFLLGLGKKLILADTFAQFSDVGFNAAAHGADLSFFEAWYAALAYALQIYFDFSGYSDMAIGLARMLNVQFPLNFNSPYQAHSISDFWRRWHITLSSFLRDYLYIQLGGNRRGELRRHLNLMITMLLGGLWHGAGWNFVAWGGLHGVFLMLHAAWRRAGLRLPRFPAQALTLLAIIVAWVPFRAADMHATSTMLRGMVGLNGIAIPRMIIGWLPPLAALADSVSVLPHLGDARTLSFPEVSGCLLLGWFIVLMLPHVHAISDRARSWVLTTSFAFTVQALFFAPSITPFLYFRF